MVIGVGALGRHHARILSTMDGVHLTAVADPRPEIGRQVAEDCHTQWVADYAQCLDQIDAVTIVVPTSAHREVGLRCLQAGVDVLIEKPLASRSSEGLELVSQACESNAVLQVGHVERFNPAFSVLREQCGTPRYIRAERLSPYAFRSMDIGAVHDLMIHDIDLILSLVGAPVDRVEAFGMSLVGGREDAVQARLGFRNGCVADLVANRVSPQTRRTLQAWSDRGCFHADLASRQVIGFRPTPELLAGSLPFELAQQPGADIPRLKEEMFGRFIAVDESQPPAADPLTAELQHFVQCVRTRQRPCVSGAEGLAALEVADCVVKCVLEHEWDGHRAGRVGPCPWNWTSRQISKAA